MDVLDLLDHPHEYASWVTEIGAEKATELTLTAFKEKMMEDGVRSILPYIEKMDYLCAQLEEWVVK